MKKFLIIAAVLVLAGSTAAFVLRNGSQNGNEHFKRIKVEQGTIVEKALAVGKIGPKHEIVVKSQNSGLVEQLYKEVGDEVVRGEPLMVIKPEPTPLELADTRRQVQLAELGAKNAERELARSKELLEKSLVSHQEYERLEQKSEEARLQMLQVRERLELIEKGKAQIAGRSVETVIRSPISGTILERLINFGDPVVPLTTYQPGTELMKLADMNNLVFSGTVDEIDVGKLREGMPASIYIGALPGDTLEGELTFISPKSSDKEGATVFDIEIRIRSRGAGTLRAGYSSNADIFLMKKEDIPILPERLVIFRNDSSLVKVLGADSTIVEKAVTVGMSDGINIEVVDGLALGDEVIEEPPKEIK
ncbi:efflux RND transporter periplasmic adaptor subunit [Gemmatimonadota bacterium]